MSLKAFSMALVALALAACSSQPRERSGGTPAAAPAAPAPTAANLAPGTSAPAASGSTSDKPVVLSRTLINAGYKATTIKGEVFYCRSEDVIGTGFKRKVCLNEAQLRDQERRIKEMQDRMIQSQASPACAPMPSCAS
jgi:hypothetical protein